MLLTLDTASKMVATSASPASCTACLIQATSTARSSLQSGAVLTAAATVVACHLALQQHGSTACPGYDVPASTARHAVELLPVSPCWSSTTTHKHRCSTPTVHNCREFMALFDPNGPEGARLLHVLLSQHAALLVSGLLSAFNSTQDLGVSLVGG
jgi:hypothetical protein